jgi:hypothetical protein
VTYLTDSGVLHLGEVVKRVFVGSNLEAGEQTGVGVFLGSGSK